MERAKELTLILLLISVAFFSVSVLAQQDKPKSVVLANSIDYELASDFFEFLRNRGIEVIHSAAADFGQYKETKFIVILGGHEAYEGVGDIVKGILTPQEMKYIKSEGNRKMYIKTNVWAMGQVVMVIAGSDRHQTKKSHEENRNSVSSAAVEAYKPTWTPAPPKDKGNLT
ncbi:MAG: hypothetical protein V3T58_04550 [Candidatus Hydrothermarchaeales archaeon]